MLQALEEFTLAARGAAQGLALGVLRALRSVVDSDPPLAAMEGLVASRKVLEPWPVGDQLLEPELADRAQPV